MLVRTGAVAGQAGQLRVHAGVQVHHEAAFAQQLAIARCQHRAAASGQHLAATAQQRRQDRAFARTEARFALAVEDRGDAGAGARFDLAVGVHERQAEAPGQAPADRGLAGPHGTDQHEVGGRVHAPRSY